MGVFSGVVSRVQVRDIVVVPSWHSGNAWPVDLTGNGLCRVMVSRCGLRSSMTMVAAPLFTLHPLPSLPPILAELMTFRSYQG